MRNGKTLANAKVARNGAVTFKSKTALKKGSYKVVAGGLTAKLTLR